MPRLEMISRLPVSPWGGPPLLFIHGAFSGAWIWDVKVLGHLAARGFAVHALSLRGHGGSAGHDRLDVTGIADYVEDVADAAAELGQPAVLVGHSMGGFVAQDFLRGGGRAAGLVLMASVPPHGLWDCVIGMSVRNPDAMINLALYQTWGKSAANLEAIGRALFSQAMSGPEMQVFEDRFQNESKRAVWDLLAVPALRPHWQPEDLPVLVLGAGEDRFVPPPQVDITARSLGTTATILPGMSHTMMLDPLWQSAADLIADWVAARYPA